MIRILKIIIDEESKVIHNKKGDVMKHIIHNLTKGKWILASFLSLTVLLVPTFCKAQNLLSGPQKIVIDPKRDRLLVSNYNTGDLIQIDSSGTQTPFVLGADYRDGLEIVGDTIYGVGSNRIIHAYDLVTKQPVMNVHIEGSNNNYLSSITSDSSGHLFISCPMLNTIYRMRISDQSYWIFAENNGLNKPNGIQLERENNRIVVIDDSPSPSQIHAISLTDSTVSTLKTTSFNRPDGIVRDNNGYYYVGGYYLPGLYKINHDFSGEPELFFTGTYMVYPTYNAANNSLFITYYNQNSWGEVPLPPTSLEETGYNFNPYEFQLLQNYPNPFNPETKISYQIPESSFVTLKVYDVLSNEITALVNEEKPAGKYSVNYKASNLPSGIYFCKMSSGSYNDVKKMLLIK